MTPPISTPDDTRTLDGQKPTEILEREVGQFVKTLERPPCLAIVELSEPTTATELKRRACERVGIEFFVDALVSPSIAEAEAAIQRLNESPGVDGIFVPYPVSNDLDSCFDLVRPDKDVDGLSRDSFSAFSAGDADAHPPATAAAVMTLLAHHGIDVRGRQCLVLDDGERFSPALGLWLHRAGASVTRGSGNAPPAPISADILIACGPPGALSLSADDDVSIVIDACYGRDLGAVDVSSAKALYAHAPARGAIGPMTVAMLLVHTARSAARRQNHQYTGRLARDTVFAPPWEPEASTSET